MSTSITFKLGMKLEVQAKGILNGDMARYLEENLVRFYEQEGQKQIMKGIKQPK